MQLNYTKMHMHNKQSHTKCRDKNSCATKKTISSLESTLAKKIRRQKEKDAQSNLTEWYGCEKSSFFTKDKSIRK